MANEKLSAREQWNRVAGFGFLVFFAVYIYSFWNQMHHLEGLCAAAKPGTPVVALGALVKEYGFSFHDLGIKSGEGGYVLSIPASMAMGGKACDIYHDGKVVVRAGFR